MFHVAVYINLSSTRDLNPKLAADSHDTFFFNCSFDIISYVSYIFNP
jgi:hypothetical protein